VRFVTVWAALSGVASHSRGRPDEVEGETSALHWMTDLAKETAGIGRPAGFRSPVWRPAGTHPSNGQQALPVELVRLTIDRLPI
jgi:hypothetical protein